MKWYEVAYLDAENYEWYYEGGFRTKTEAIKYIRKMDKKKVIYIDIEIFVDDDLADTIQYYTNKKNYEEYRKTELHI